MAFAAGQIGAFVSVLDVSALDNKAAVRPITVLKQSPFLCR